MATLTLKNIPTELHRRLKERAARNRRSLNNEAIHCLEQALAAAPTEPESYLDRIRPLRQKTNRLPLTEERLRAAREEGRS
ncbi:MAG: Arc family DNA-binding protein [Rhodothermales bacterium]